MRSHRRICNRRFFLTGLAIVALPAAIPSLAAGSSLLSGYGGPGQGSQAILGSALVGGGGGSSSGGGGSSSGGAGGPSGPSRLGEPPGRTETATGATGAAAGGTGSVPAPKSARGASRSRSYGAGQKPAGSAGAAGKGGDRAATAALASGAGTGQAETLGLSGGDLLYVLLALAALAFTGALTRLLVRTSGPEQNNC